MIKCYNYLVLGRDPLVQIIDRISDRDKPEWIN